MHKLDIDWDNVGLGERSDKSIAEEVGCNAGTVTYQRRKRSIPTFRAGSKFDWENIPLGKLPDRTIAQVYGMHWISVHRERTYRKIPACPETASDILARVLRKILAVDKAWS
jgi:hypothetical protein